MVNGRWPIRGFVMKKMVVAVLLLFASQSAGAGEADQAKVTPQVTVEQGKIEQKAVCFTKKFEISEGCVPGQKIFFQSDTPSGRAALLFVAEHCDFNYPVAMNDDGVICVYMPYERYTKTK